MKSVDETIEEIHRDAQRALAEHPDKTPLDPSVSYEQAFREWFQYGDEVELPDEVHFRIGQHMARVAMCAVLEAIAQFPVTPDQRFAAYLRYVERSRNIHEKLKKEFRE